MYPETIAGPRLLAGLNEAPVKGPNSSIRTKRAAPIMMPCRLVFVTVSVVMRIVNTRASVPTVSRTIPTNGLIDETSFVDPTETEKAEGPSKSRSVNPANSPPMTWKLMYGIRRERFIFPETTWATVTAGLMCAEYFPREMITPATVAANDSATIPRTSDELVPGNADSVIIVPGPIRTSA